MMARESSSQTLLFLSHNCLPRRADDFCEHTPSRLGLNGPPGPARGRLRRPSALRPAGGRAVTSELRGLFGRMAHLMSQLSQTTLPLLPAPHPSHTPRRQRGALPASSTADLGCGRKLCPSCPWPRGARGCTATPGAPGQPVSARGRQLLEAPAMCPQTRSEDGGA